MLDRHDEIGVGDLCKRIDRDEAAQCDRCGCALNETGNLGAEVGCGKLKKRRELTSKIKAEIVA